MLAAGCCRVVGASPSCAQAFPSAPGFVGCCPACCRRRLTSDALVPSSSKAQAAGRPGAHSWPPANAGSPKLACTTRCRLSLLPAVVCQPVHLRHLALSGSGAPRDTAPLKLGLRVDVGAGEDAATPGGDSQPGSAIRAYVPPFSLLPSPAAGDAALGSGAGSRPVQPGSSCPASRPWCSPPARRSSSPRRSSINSPPPGMAPLPDLKRLQPLRPPPPAPLGAAAHTFGCSGSSPGGSSPAAALQRMPQQLFKLPPEQERAHRYERLL